MILSVGENQGHQADAIAMVAALGIPGKN